MLEELQNHIQRYNHTLSLRILTNKAFIASLTSNQFAKLTKVLQNSISNINLNSSNKSLHPKVALTIYCVLIMNGYKQYNSKFAIDFLCKYYRYLQTQQNKRNTSNVSSLKIIANLLLRIPTFSNYKLVIKNIDPKFTPISLVLEHRQKMKKQCSILFQQYIINAYKYQYPSIITFPAQVSANKSIINDEQDQYQIIPSQNNNHTLHKQIQILITQPLAQIIEFYNNRIQNISSHTQIYQLIYQKKQQLNKNMQYLKYRISYITKQQIHIEKVFELFHTMFYDMNYQSQKNIIISNILNQLSLNVIIECKNWVFCILTEIVRKCQYTLIRKIGWINKLINSTLNDYYKQFKYVDLVPIIDLIKVIYEVYGHGFSPFKNILFISEASISNLIRSLCLNPHSDTVKAHSQMNTQSKKKQNLNKPMLQVSLNPSLVDTPFQQYLSTRTTQQIRNQIMIKCMELLITYYSPQKCSHLQKNDICQKDAIHASEIIAIIQNSKNVLSSSVLQKTEELSYALFKGVGTPIQGQFWNFCSNTFDELFRRKSQRPLALSKIPDVYIQPTKKVKSQYDSVQPEPSQVPFTHRNSFPQQSKQIRKTKSFDVSIQGWQSNDDKKVDKNHSSKKVSNKSVSQMFYSIKQCSEENDQSKDKEQMQQEFILTPNFD